MISDNELARAIFGTDRRDAPSTTTIMAKAVEASGGGSVLVTAQGAALGADASFEVPTAGGIAAGDTVLVTVKDGAPVDAVSAGGVDRAQQNIARIDEMATESAGDSADVKQQIADFKSGADVDYAIYQYADDEIGELSTTVEATYLKQSDAATTYATQTSLTQTAQSIEQSVESTYLKQADAATTYATKSALTVAEASIRSDVSETYSTKTETATAKSEAISAAATDATTKANAAQSAAISAAATDATSKANAAQTAATNAANAYTDNAVSGLASDADLSALTTRVSTNETNIEQNATDIALKANASDVYTKQQSDGLITTEVANRNAAIQTAVDGITSTVSQTYSTKTELSNAVDDINQGLVWYATCPTAAATAVKAATTANSGFVLTEGAMVNVKFTYTNSAAVANLKLNVNGTGEKPIKYIYNNSLNNLPAVGYLLANNMYTFRYDGTNWVAQLMYNTNNYDRTNHSNTCKATASTYKTIDGVNYGIAGSSIVAWVSDGYKTLAAGDIFDFSRPILWVTGNVKTAATFTSAYEVYPSCTLRNNVASWTGTQYAMAYLKGTISGNQFTLDATTPITSTEPTSDDGFYYVPLGQLYSTYQIAFRTSDRLFAFKNGSFQRVDNAASNAAAGAQSTADRASTAAGNASAAVTELRTTTQTSIQQLSDRVDVSVSAVSARVDAQGEVVSQVEKNFTFDQNGLTIGQSDSPVKANLDNTALRFKANGQDTLVINGETSTAEIDRLKIGKYRWQAVDNGNAIALVYVG